MAKPNLTNECMLFDLDGTLLDTGPDMATALNLACETHQLETLSYTKIRPWISQGSFALARLALNSNTNRPAIDDDDPQFERFRMTFLQAYRDHVADKTDFMPGVEAVIETIERRNIPWGIVTNKPGWLTEPIMRALGLDQRASCVVSGDTTAHAKPHPAPLLFAAERLNIAPSKCAIIGDDKRDIEAGQAAGMSTIAAAFGYVNADDDPATWGADLVVQSPSALLEHLNDF